LIEPNDLAYLGRQLSIGELVLFTGAGFSSGCKARDGSYLPIGRELKEAIWPHAFPSSPFNDSETLGEVFEVAQRQNRNALKATLESRLTIDPTSIPNWYHPYMHGPWFRVYTLNFDNFWDLAPTVDPDARQLTTVSALSDETLPPDSRAAVIHLNGRLADYPNTTFSPRQFGERSAGVEKWYVQLTSDLFGHPIIFIGTELNEPPFWEYLALRRRTTERTRDRRPKSFLVSPGIGLAKRQLLQELNIVFVEANAEQFATEVLDKVDSEARVGMALLTQRRTHPTSAQIIEEVSVLRKQPPPSLFDTAEFLLGRQPTWQDLNSGFVVKRDFDQELADAIATSGELIILVTGTAGTGKSSSLFQAAAALQEDGRRVLWFDGLDETELHIWQLRNRIKELDADYLFIDSADTFGPVSGTFLAEIVADNPRLVVIASARANRLRIAGLERDSLHALEMTVPGLADTDIDFLIDALDAANRLGSLKGKSRDEQRRQFQRSYDRQLLVAMLEATSGKHFEDIIKEECEDLQGPAYEIYASTSFVTSLGTGIRREELLLAVGGDTAQALADLRHLLDRRLLLSDNRGFIRARHRVIAEKAIDHVKTSGHLPRIIEGVTYAIATKIGPDHDVRSREHRLLVRLINHDFLIAQLTDTALIRPIYSTIEDILNWDFHYFLQRGSFEVERGSITLAENFLNQAKSLAGDNLLVRTEWAYMLMVKACGELEAGLTSHREHADAAFEELYDVIAARGEQTPYPYHVLARQGTNWVVRASLSPTERATYLERILAITREGVRRHPHSRELRLIETEVQKAYLLTSAVGSPPASH